MVGTRLGIGGGDRIIGETGSHGLPRVTIDSDVDVDRSGRCEPVDRPALELDAVREEPRHDMAEQRDQFGGFGPHLVDTGVERRPWA